MKKISPFSWYLVYFAALSCLGPYMVLFYQGLGFSGVQIGLLMGMFPLVAMVGAPLWTGMADAKGRHKLIMSLTILVTVGLAIVFPLLKTFAPMVVLVMLYSLFSAPITSFADSSTMTMLAGEKEMYGRVRLGGTIGWGLVAPVGGALIQAYGLKLAFWVYAGLMFLTFIISQKFTFGQHVEGGTIRGNVRQLMADRRWLLFLILAFTGGVAITSINNYLFPYMEELGASKTTMGIALTLSTIGELPVLFYANRLLRRFKAYGLLTLGMTITGVRLLLYAAFNFPLGILIFQLLNGMTFPIVWVAAVSYAYENAPEGMKATAVGLLAAVMFGIGSATGGFTGGLLLESIGGRGMYLVFGTVVLVCVLVITLLERRQTTVQPGRV